MNTEPKTWITAAEAELEAHDVAPDAPVDRMRLYGFARNGVFPPGVTLRLGRTIRFHRERLRAWLEGGGGALPGGWRRGGPAA